MKKINFLTIVLGIFMLMFGQAVFSQSDKGNDDSEIQQQCRSINEKVQFCINTPNISVKLGEPIILLYSLKNITDEKVDVPSSRNGRFNLSAFDDNNNKIPTIFEDLGEKMKARNLTEEENQNWISFIVSDGSGRDDKPLAPEEEKNYSLSFKRYYCFDAKGQYRVEVNQKTKKDESDSIKSPLAIIDVEIK